MSGNGGVYDGGPIENEKKNNLFCHKNSEINFFLNYVIMLTRTELDRVAYSERPTFSASYNRNNGWRVGILAKHTSIHMQRKIKLNYWQNFRLVF